jgi:adenylyltransferase/sulfurtransferase
MDDIVRYSRQLLLQDGFGVTGQCKLLSSSVLVVGAGGIASTLVLYLAASGVGHFSVADFDDVDMSNLHRQVIHRDCNVGLNKAVSACRAALALNPTVRCSPIQEPLTFDNALAIVSRHDVVVDASDNPRTRYLVNDACVFARKPLISGSAMGTEGQLTVYNYDNGPCFRCLYPNQSASEGCKSCSDNGVLGPVPGLIGILQAVEVIKLITGIGKPMNDRLLMYDSLRCSFVNVKKPPKSGSCPICGEKPQILTMKDSKAFSVGARGPAGVNVDGSIQNSPNELPALSKALEISCTDYNEIRRGGVEHVLLDVRVKEQFAMCSLEGSTNIPLAELESQIDRVEELSGGVKPVFCLCRRGIASAYATHKIDEATKKRGLRIHAVRNITGGLAAWSAEVDPYFPKY